MHRMVMPDDTFNIDQDSGIASSVLQTELAHLRVEVEQLRSENEVLKTERQSLMDENRDLRREATLVRLYRAIGARSATNRADGAASISVPTAAAELYHGLPESFKFADYFRHASVVCLDTQTARECLLYFLNECLLVQVGSRLRKTDIVFRHI
jgi:exosome complex RNA-binding protein Csl4